MVKIPWERLKREGRSGLSPEGPSIQGRSAGEGAGGGMGPLSGGQEGPGQRTWTSQPEGHRRPSRQGPQKGGGAASEKGVPSPPMVPLLLILHSWGQFSTVLRTMTPVHGRGQRYLWLVGVSV